MRLTESVKGDDACPVCGGEPGRTIYPDARDPITLDTFQIVACSHCTTTYTAPRPSSLNRYYPHLYREYGRFVTSVLRAFYDARVSRWARLKPAGGSVLEVGCGRGLMLAAFSRQGWKTTGIERNEEAAEAARRAFGLDVSAKPVEALPLDARFDLIIMFHVLEHIAAPVTLLGECAKRLAPGGRIILNVPNFASWQSRFGGSNWFHLDPPRHLTHFTPETLAATLQRAGLKLADVNFVSFEHDPYGWVESSINRLTGRKNTLTRFLMGLDAFGPAVPVSLLLGAALFLPAVILSLISWVAKRGALMEAVAVASSKS
jgi:2-polyprenyl-3-methyl-5-hydroxy-6-metoxy-1,4-benzoquinol methylase